MQHHTSSLEYSISRPTQYRRHNLSGYIVAYHLSETDTEFGDDGGNRLTAAFAATTNNSAHLSQDRTLDGWCQFWQTVPRCSGVREFCKSRSMEELPVGR